MNKFITTNFGTIEYEFKRSKSKRRISIKVKNDGKVVLSAPNGVPIREAEEFLLSKAKWVTFHSNKSRREYQRLQSAELDFIYILGKPYAILYKDGEKANVCFKQGKIVLIGEKTDALNLLKESIVQFADKYFSERFKQIAYKLKVGENFKQVTRNVKSVWGSCDVKRKIIKLSVRLIAREQKVVDSVIYHEFAHIAVQNHQREFYDLLLTYCPNYFEYQKGLKNACYALTDKFILGK